MVNNLTLQFGDRISVTTPTAAALLGVFVSMTGETLTWIAIGPTTGAPTVLITNLEGATIEKLT
ncbi:hypothetical protein SFC08_09135 [Lysinibacillus halotolerans]|uniref:hypothetical protein n=1 Tax=Ureibacillus sp. FSL E2-3493 TaxID=2921367 RepID=UPI0031196297